MKYRAVDAIYVEYLVRFQNPPCEAIVGVGVIDVKIVLRRVYNSPALI